MCQRRYNDVMSLTRYNCGDGGAVVQGVYVYRATTENISNLDRHSQMTPSQW
jgi:hypothetical protein